MPDQPLQGKSVLITGSARRLGRRFALACARRGADVVIHHGHSDKEAESLRAEIESMGRRAWIFIADLSEPGQARGLIPEITESTRVDALVNSASIFEKLSLEDTSLDDWSRHLAINLTAPFLLCQAFARQAQPGARIVNIVDWRALRPGPDHFPYTITKAALASMTESMAIALAPEIMVNALALGAILPPAEGTKNPDITRKIPARRWSRENEPEEALLFLLTGPEFITGEIIHVDGGRHLV